ncbi:MAG: nuclear transport factor 2 family protein [Pseudomonadota bacterium]
MSAVAVQLPDAGDRAAIEQLLSGFTWFADRHDAGGLAALFTEDARMNVAGKVIDGRAAMLADLAVRLGDPARKTRHIWANLRYLPAQGGAIRTAIVQQTFEQDGDSPARLRINDITDTFRRDASGAWKISERLIERGMSLALPNHGA